MKTVECPLIAHYGNESTIMFFLAQPPVISKVYYLANRRSRETAFVCCKLFFYEPTIAGRTTNDTTQPIALLPTTSACSFFIVAR